MAKILFEDTERLRQAMTTPLSKGGIHFWDPQCDMPLDETVEKSIDQMTPFVYCRWLCQEYNIDFDPIPPNEYDARRAARKAVRTLPQFTGERYYQ